jgi:hypothetical protein
MKKLILPVVAFLLLLTSSCTKDKDDDSTDSGKGTFEARQDGQLVKFNIESATLILSESTSEKRLDISGLSTDGSKRVVLTFYEEVGTGNSVSAKTYDLWYWNNDNPNTSADESEEVMDGLFTYGMKLGANWMYDVFGTQATLVVSQCNESSKKISGTFKCKLIDLSDDSIYTEFTEGKFSNVVYTVAKI